MKPAGSLLSALKNRWRTLVRFAGIGLLVWLLLRIDIKSFWQVLTRVELGLAIPAALLLIPLIGLKALRWQVIMGRPLTWRRSYQATLSYFSGLFLGFLTPGRLGEFVRVIYARRQLGGKTAAATISVLADRLFDLSALFLFGGLAFFELAETPAISAIVGWVFIALGAVIPAALVFVSWGSWWVRLIGDRQLRIWDLPVGDWLRSLAGFSPAAMLLAIPLTVAAYALFFGQGLLLMSALGLEQSYLTAAFTLSMAGLVALLPISISGLGTREWIVTLYLGTQGISPERALAFSALVFLAFNIWGSLLGGASWLIYPESFKLESESDHGPGGSVEAATPDWLVGPSSEGS